MPTKRLRMIPTSPKKTFYFAIFAKNQNEFTFFYGISVGFDLHMYEVVRS